MSQCLRAGRDYFFAAGAKVATTNSYAIHHDRLIPVGLNIRFELLHRADFEIARTSRDAAGGGLVAGAIGLLIGSQQIEPLPQDARERFAYVCRIQAPYVDQFLIQTVLVLDHVCKTLAGASVRGKPVSLSMSVDDYDGTKPRSGEPLEAVMDYIDGTDALLAKSAAPEAVTVAVGAIEDCDKQFAAYANRSKKSPRALCRWVRPLRSYRRADLTPDDYSAFAEEWANMGATIISGCCEVGPAHIAQIVRRLT